MDNTTSTDNITIKTIIEAMFGKNTVRGEIFEIISDTTFRAKNLRTGKNFVTSKGRIKVIESPAEEAEKNISKPIELLADTIFITETKNPTFLPEEPQAEEAPAAPAAVEKKSRKMSLFAIALATLETKQVPMCTGEILSTAEKLGLYHAEDWGKPPPPGPFTAPSSAR